MKKYAIVLCGDHGGELDRTVFELDETMPAGAVIECVRGWTINAGDTIRIESED